MEWKKLITTIMIITALNSALYAPNLNSKDKDRKELNKERMTRLDYLMRAEFSPENVLALITVLEMPSPDIIYNQSRLETANFTSRVFKEGNNLFGIHFARIRDSYAFEFMIADNGRRVAKYRSWQSSVLDLKLQIEYYERLGYNSYDYYKFLRDTGYCENDNYTNILKSMT